MSASTAGPPADLTFVIPAKDRAALLEQTLRSVEAQTVRPAAVIICDDGSVEDVAAVAESSGALCLRNDRGDWGAGAARNFGIERVTTEFVWFLDSDDLLLPRAVELLVSALAAAPASPFAYAASLIAEREGGEWHVKSEIWTLAAEAANPYASLFVRNHVPTSCAVARTAAVREAGGFPESLEFSEDHALWLELARRGRPVYVPELVGIHRVGGRHLAFRALECDLRIAAEAGSDPALAPLRADRDGVLLGQGLYEVLNTGDLGAAPSTLWQLLLSRPQRLRILRSFARSIRLGRHAQRRGITRWKEDSELRDWLGTYE